MEDEQILALFDTRDEAALTETKQKFGGLCVSIAERILGSRMDADEAFSDMLLRVWNAIPPAHPLPLAPYFSAVIRRICFDRYDAAKAAKRGNGQVPLALEELEECIPAAHSPESECDARQMKEAVNRFLGTLPKENRRLFLERYYLLKPYADIAEQYGISQSKAKMTISRIRKKLKEFLETEGYL